ncbi:MAG: sulfite exporter TauE/SafE family protein [Chloroflexota bacterium]
MARSILVPVGVGVVAGFFSGMTGVGGGAILVSLMVNFMGLTQHRAHGTSLAVIISVSLAAAVSYALPFLLGYPAKFEYDPDLARQLIPTLAIASMFGVILGAKIMAALPSRQLRRLFGVFLFFVAMSMFARGIQVGNGPTDMNIWPFPAWVVLGFIAGVFSGILGIGGALVMVPVMTIGAGIEQHMTQGITLAVICITTLTGAYTHYRLGNVDLRATLAIAPAAVICGFLAGQLAAQIDTIWLTRVFGAAMLYFSYQFTFTGAPQRKPAPTPAPQRS